MTETLATAARRGRPARRHGLTFPDDFKLAPRAAARGFASCAAVEPAVLDRLGDVLGGDVGGAGQVGYGARHLEDSIVTARRQTQARHREPEELRRGRRQDTPPPGL